MILNNLWRGDNITMKLEKYKTLLLTLGVSILFASTANAYTVTDAVHSARETNAKLKSAREQTKSVKTEKAKALTTWLPSITTDSVFTTTYAKAQVSRPFLNGDSRRNILTATQPLFTGFSSYYSYDKAKNLSEAAEYFLKATKENTILNAVSAYEDLNTAKEIYNFNIKNEETFAKRLNETQERFNLGEATITDVAQSESKLAEARFNKARAIGDTNDAEANFAHVIGIRAPQDLEPIEAEAVKIPATLEDFLEIVMHRNPTIAKLKSDAKAATNDTQLAFTKLAPIVTANAQYTRTNTAKIPSKIDSNQYFVEVKFPIFDQGTDYVGIKQARYNERRSKWDLEETKQAIEEAAIQTWSQYQAAKSQMEFGKQAISASNKALEGVQEEAKVGTRTVLDVLDAETALFSAKVSYRQAQRNYIVSLFTMHTLMGTAEQLPILRG